MSPIAWVLVIFLVIFLMGGFAGVGGGPFYGLGYRGGGISVGAIILIVILIWFLTGGRI